MAVDLGGQMARPALRFPALTTRGQFGFVEDHRHRRINQHRVEFFQAFFDRRFQRHQHHLRRGIAERLHVDGVGIVFQHDVGADFVQGRTQVFPRLARARQ